MKFTIDMPGVRACDVTACGYNVDQNCHARAITIGDGVHPACDTFFPSERHTADAGQTAGVGACKVSQCQHNSDFECQADAIQVGPHEHHGDCQTFSPG